MRVLERGRRVQLLGLIRLQRTIYIMNFGSTWEEAQSPNYTVNVDKCYPYSEVPYIGQYKLVKIPLGHELIELVDYWGEGRIETEFGTTGLPDCYNVNLDNQVVGLGTDRERKIPNRVPVKNDTKCDTSSYIKDNSVKIVTVMARPINRRCAKDIARMVNKEQGKVFIFALDDFMQDAINLELSDKDIIPCYGYELPAALEGLTIYDNIRTEWMDLKKALRTNIIEANYDEAVEISKAFAVSNYANCIQQVVSVLLSESNINALSYACKVWNSDIQRLFYKYFPIELKHIFNEDKVIILNKRFNQALKLANALDSDNDRKAHGVESDTTTKRVSWKFMLIWDNGNVTFKLLNVACGSFLKLAVQAIDADNREAWGDYDCPVDDRFYWDLKPVMQDGELLFFVVNRKYQQGLALAEATDSAGDRELWGLSADFHNDVSRFGWYIKWYN